MNDKIVIKGAKEHNLKNINVQSETIYRHNDYTL